MMSLPPKRNLTPTKNSRQYHTPLQTLLQMGFPKHRAEKALAATGHAGAQVACDWLLAHVNDPFLDDTSPREYILYVCPTGPFLQQLQIFWQKSFALCGWNGAHNFTPHITLVSFFKAPDEDCLNLAQSLQTVIEKEGAVLDEPLKLETYTSPNFMGFFVAEEHADYLKRMAIQYVKEVSTAIINDTYEQFDALTACFPWCTTTTARCIPRGSRSISLEPHVKSLHLTLAYQFPGTQYSSLKQLVDELDINAECNWELRLYSKDPRINGKQVYRAIHSHSPTEADELELNHGDLIYVNGEALAMSADGWVEGTSWLTGNTGLVPINFIERTAESDAWTLHKKVILNKVVNLPQEVSASNNMDNGMTGTMAHDTSVESLYHKSKDQRSPSECSQSKNGSRELFIMRHAERIDFTFGSWVPYCFDENDKYIRRDLNMPVALPQRKYGSKAYLKDSPLTNMGLVQARIIGEALLNNNVTIEHVYCSPAYRCIQTCDSLLQGMNCQDRVKIRVEPGLFEFMAWYPPESVPEWMTTEELLAAGFNIDQDYKPFVDERELKESSENCDQFYLRSAFVTRSALATSAEGNILFVGHTATLDSCSHELLGRMPRPVEEMMKIIQKVPYCSLVQLSEMSNEWKLCKPPCLPLTHAANGQFNWKILLQ